MPAIRALFNGKSYDLDLPIEEATLPLTIALIRERLRRGWGELGPLRVEKLLYRGKQLKDDVVVIPPGSSIMVFATLVANSGADSGEVGCSAIPSSNSAAAAAVVPQPFSLDPASAMRAAGIKEAAERLLSRRRDDFNGNSFFAVLENQSGKTLSLPPHDERMLKLGILLHRLGRSIVDSSGADIHSYLHKGRPVESSLSQSAPTAESALLPSPVSASTSTSFPIAASSPSTSSSAQSSPLAPASNAAAGTAATEAMRLALHLFLEADKAFAQVNSVYFDEMLDNAAMCYLDTVWCFFRLGDSSLAHFKEANRYLIRARKGFEKVHGDNLERLVQLKGDGAAERIVYIRLSLLEGVLRSLQGDAAAEVYLMRARADCDLLRCSDTVLATMMSLYDVTRSECMEAWRATAHTSTFQDSSSSASDSLGLDRTSRAVSWLFQRRDERAARAVADKRRRRSDHRTRRLGPTVSGHAVNLHLLDALMGMLGMEEAIVAEALRLCDNNEEGTCVMLTENVGVVMASLAERAGQSRNAAADAGRGAAGAGRSTSLVSALPPGAHAASSAPTSSTSNVPPSESGAATAAPESTRLTATAAPGPESTRLTSTEQAAASDTGDANYDGDDNSDDEENYDDEDGADAHTSYNAEDELVERLLSLGEEESPLMDGLELEIESCAIQEWLVRIEQ